MSWEIEADEVQRLLVLPARERAAVFFQLVADWEEVWGLEDPDGWVVAKETDALPLWPHAAFAEACARGPWQGALPAAVSLDDLQADLLAILAEDGLGVAVFPTPDDPGIRLSANEFRERLEQELALGDV
jgi:uncharacterized protein DUF2750